MQAGYPRSGKQVSRVKTGQAKTGPGMIESLEKTHKTEPVESVVEGLLRKESRWGGGWGKPWEEGKIWNNRRVMAEILSTQVQIAACACCSISKNRKLTPSVWVNFYSKQPRLNSLTKLELNMSASVCISTFMNLCHVLSLCAVDTAVHILPKMPCLFTNVVQAPRNSCKVVKPSWHSS